MPVYGDMQKVSHYSQYLSKHPKVCSGGGEACPIASLFGESGWVPYNNIMMIKFNILRFRKRIMKMDGDRLTRKF